MKDQSKKTFSDASRQIPTKSEDIIKTEESFTVEETNHLPFQDSCSQQIKIMTHITPGEIIVITNKSQIL